MEKMFLMERIDRFLISEEWLGNDFAAESTILKGALSDHWPVCLSQSKGNRPWNASFRFESMWMSHKEFEPQIQEWWNELCNLKGTKM
jgi:hypothetical protein